jgi:hypothetical protein
VFLRGVFCHARTKLLLARQTSANSRSAMSDLGRRRNPSLPPINFHRWAMVRRLTVRTSLRMAPIAVLRALAALLASGRGRPAARRGPLSDSGSGRQSGLVQRFDPTRRRASITTLRHEIHRAVAVEWAILGRQHSLRNRSGLGLLHGVAAIGRQPDSIRDRLVRSCGVLGDVVVMRWIQLGKFRLGEGACSPPTQPTSDDTRA